MTRAEPTVIAHGEGSLEFEEPFAEPAERIHAALDEADESDTAVPWSSLVDWPVDGHELRAVLESMPGVQRDSNFHDADMPGFSGQYTTFSCVETDVSSVLRQLETVGGQLWTWIARDGVDQRAADARKVAAAGEARRQRRRNAQADREKTAADHAASLKEATRRGRAETEVRLSLEALDGSPGHAGESSLQTLKSLESLEPPSAAPVAASALLRFLEAMRQEEVNRLTAVRAFNFLTWLSRNVSRQDTVAATIAIRTRGEVVEVVAGLSRLVQRLQEHETASRAKGSVPYFAMPVWGPCHDATLPWLQAFQLAVVHAETGGDAGSLVSHARPSE